MNSPLQKTQASALHEDCLALQDAYAKTGKLNDLTHQRLVREAQKLCTLSSVSAWEGYRLLAALAALKGQRRDCQTHYQAAEKLGVLSGIPLQNKIVSFLSLGLWDDAEALLPQVVAGIADAPMDVDYLAMTARIAWQLGKFDTLHTLVDAFDRRNLLDRLPISPNTITLACDLMAEHGVTEQAVFERIAFAAAQLFARYGKPLGGFCCVVLPVGIRCQIVLPFASIAEVVEADFFLAEQMVAQFEHPLADLITLSTTRSVEP